MQVGCEALKSCITHFDYISLIRNASSTDGSPFDLSKKLRRYNTPTAGSSLRSSRRSNFFSETWYDVVSISELAGLLRPSAALSLEISAMSTVDLVRSKGLSDQL